jgi:hypothetical protein
MSHAVVAVHQGGRRRGLAHLDVGPRIDPAGTQAPHILRQPEYPMGVGAGQIRLGHQLRDLGGIVGRQSHLGQRILDEAGDGRSRYSRWS